MSLITFDLRELHLYFSHSGREKYEFGLCIDKGKADYSDTHFLLNKDELYRLSEMLNVFASYIAQAAYADDEIVNPVTEDKPVLDADGKILTKPFTGKL